MYVTVINKDVSPFSCETQHFMATARVARKVLILHSYFVTTVVHNTAVVVNTTVLNMVAH